MKPVLFEPNSTDFATNGVGRLSDAVSCVVTEERNGAFELEMTYPVDGVHFDKIVHSAIILAKPSARRSAQAFRIYSITKPMNGEITILAEHISYQLNHIPVMPFSASTLAQALAAFGSNAAEPCPFTLSADFEVSSAYTVGEPQPIRACLGGDGDQASVLDVYGGEWEFNNYSAVLHQSRGQSNGIRIMYGKNLVTLEQEENISEVYTGVLPFWKSEATQVVLPEKVVHSANAANYPYNRTIIQDFSSDFQTVPTAAQLRSAAEAFLAQPGVGVPLVSISLEWVNLADTLEYRDLLTGNVDLCDIVRVTFEKLGVDREAEIISIRYNVLAERYETLEIGDKAKTLADTIETQMKQLEITPTTAEVQTTVDRATGLLNAGARGHVVINRNASGYANEIYFMDTDNTATAVNVLRINVNGIGFSSTGISGPYSQSWTLDAHLSLGGVNNANGILQLLNSSGTVIGHFSAADGLEFTRGQNIGFKADGNSIMLGDFEVNDWYGRQILQSSDERTGMSGYPNDPGGFYFWAGWNGTYGILTVNRSGRVDIHGDLYIDGTLNYNGESLHDYIEMVVGDLIDSGGGGNSGGDGPTLDGDQDPEHGPGV